MEKRMALVKKLITGDNLKKAAAQGNQATLLIRALGGQVD